jgi:hypothetical protein
MYKLNKFCFGSQYTQLKNNARLYTWPPSIRVCEWSNPREATNENHYLRAARGWRHLLTPLTTYYRDFPSQQTCVPEILKERELLSFYLCNSNWVCKFILSAAIYFLINKTPIKSPLRDKNVPLCDCHDKALFTKLIFSHSILRNAAGLKELIFITTVYISTGRRAPALFGGRPPA